MNPKFKNVYLCNGSSMTMQRDPNSVEINSSLTEKQFTEIVLNCKYLNAIGHDSLAKYLTKVTGKTITKHRRPIKLGYDDAAIIVTLTQRLPEHPNPEDVKYKERTIYTLKRFRQQTPEELAESQQAIKCLCGGSA